MYNTVSSVVWPCETFGAGGPKKAGPASSVLIQAAVMAAIGAGLYFWLEHTAGLRLRLRASCWCPASARRSSAPSSGSQWLGRAVGAILTCLLAPFYYIVFFLMHLAQKLSKDPPAPAPFFGRHLLTPPACLESCPVQEAVLMNILGISAFTTTCRRPVRDADHRRPVSVMQVGARFHF